MGGYHTEYSGSDNGLNPDFSGSTQYRVSTSSLGLATDPRSSNQLKAVSEKLSTGAKVVEVSLGTPQANIFEAIPKQHFKELERLRKLVGAELTLHAPIIEPTGVSKQGWSETDREQAERQMWNAIKTGQPINSDGNLVITFHSSSGLPEPETAIFNEKTGKKEVKEVWFVDERTGQFGNVPVKPQYLEGKETPDVKEILKEDNQRAWANQLQHASYWADNGIKHLAEGLSGKSLSGEKTLTKEQLMEKYSNYIKGQYNPSEIGDESLRKAITEKFAGIEQGEIYVRDSYYEMKKLFDQAYDVAKRGEKEEDLKKLEKFREEVKPLLADLKNPEKVEELANVVRKGVHLLHSIDAPESHKPLRDFAIDKGSETFSNLAIRSYDEFKENSPIISIENPPAGMGLSRGEDIANLIEASRKKFAEKAVEKFGMSEKEAKEQAAKLIGATWDVGHINMLRKYGYGEKELLEEAKKIQKYAKHVHLSDNFGMEHTELPMGMGNVPTGKTLEILEKYNKQIKKVIETGDWQQHFQITPFKEVAYQFNSPIYAAANSPYWSEGTTGRMGSYYSAQATMPEIHYTTFGAGFSGLPGALSGQQGGKSRLSGSPMD